MKRNYLNSRHVIVYLIFVTILLGIQGCVTNRWRTDQKGQTKLMIAVQNGDMAQVKALVEGGTQDINAQCDAVTMHTITMTSLALTDGSTKSTLESSKNVPIRGNSALSLAILNRDVDMVRYLVKAGADTNIEVVYENHYVETPGGPVYERKPSDFKFVPEKRATISELAKMTGLPEIVAAVKQK